MAVQMTREDVVGGGAVTALGESFQTPDVAEITPIKVVVGEFAVAESVADVESALEQVDDLSGELLVRAGLRHFQVVGAPQRMSHALLMQRPAKSFVGGGAVVDQGAGVVDADDFLQGVSTA